MVLVIVRAWITRAVLMGALFLACGPPTIQNAMQTPQPTTSAASSATEINAALGALAANSPPPGTDYRIGPEDLLQITLFNIPETETRVTPRTVAVRVSEQGLVSLPLIGDIKASGLAVSAMERELQKRYEKYILNPQVGVVISEYRQRASVIGAVHKPGVFELSGPRSVMDMLAMAGGVTDKAGTQVHVYRRGPNGRESHVIDLLVLATNASVINAETAGLITMPVQRGDVINVPPAGTFFVDGAVKRPGPYPLGRNYSLTQALATAGGVDPELNSSDITIFRRKGLSGMQTMTIDYPAILAGAAVDPQIQEDDVIVVPMSTTKYFIKRFVGQLINGVSIGSVAGR